MKLHLKEKLDKIEKVKSNIVSYKANKIVWDAFIKDSRCRLSWNSISIEGNTLSIQEIVDAIDYNQVKSGHTYQEYAEARAMHHAIKTLQKFDETQTISQEWIQKVNSMITNTDGAYRTGPVIIGSVVEAIFYPPKAEKLPELMEKYEKELRNRISIIPKLIKQVAECHLKFERIHPFPDGNGRTGRMIMNQQLLNAGLLPAIIKNQSKYRQSFIRYNRTDETEMMEYVIASGILDSYNILEILNSKSKE